MKVLVDGHDLGAKTGGNERYVRNLVREASKKVEVGVFGETRVGKLREKVGRYLFEIPRLVKRERYEVVHTAYFVPPFTQAKTVVMVHDTAFWKMPEIFSLRERAQFLLVYPSLLRASAIVVPSLFAKGEIVRHHPELGGKIFVTREATDPVFRKMTEKKRKEMRKKNKWPERFYLSVGSRYAKRKPEIFREVIREEDPKASLVIVGTGREKKVVRQKGIRMVYLPYVSDQDLNELYNLAEAILYHSRYEGFGLPILEAMKVGKPIVCSDIPVFREVGGEIPYYFDNEDKESLRKQLRAIIQGGGALEKRIEDGLRREKIFSWEKCASETIKVWKKVGGEK